MNQMVQDYINSQEEKKKKEYIHDKKMLLLEIGLTEKEYAPNEKIKNMDEEYPHYDNTIKPGRHYRNIPIEITEEEYAAIRKYQDAPTEKKKNQVAGILKVIGFVYFIFGIVLGLYANNVLMWSIIGFVSGMIMIGFSEVIRLLNDIKQSLTKTE